MRTLWRVLLLSVVVLGTLLAIPAPSQAASSGWLLKCGLARSLPDDPIVHPGMRGMSHLHDFFGNTSIDATSTYQSMRAGGTTCPAGDTAGYWTPALLRNGVRVSPAGQGVREQVYFRANNLAAGTHIEPFPPDLRMIAGNSRAKSPSENPKLGREIYWGCSDNSGSGKAVAPSASCPTGIVALHVGFPNCWDGVLTHADDTPHLRYPSGGKCPPGFGRALPRLILRTEYPVGASTGMTMLSSGPTFTIHADFWNTWDQAKLQTLVDTCLNAGKSCGTFTGSGGTTSSPTSSSPTSSLGASTALSPSTTTPHGSMVAAATSSTGSSASSGQVLGATTSTGSGGLLFTSSGGLPFTGVRTSALLVLAVGLLGLGAATLVGARRRAKH